MDCGAQVRGRMEAGNNGNLHELENDNLLKHN